MATTTPSRAATQRGTSPALVMILDPRITRSYSAMTSPLDSTGAPAVGPPAAMLRDVGEPSPDSYTDFRSSTTSALPPSSSSSTPSSSSGGSAGMNRSRITASGTSYSSPSMLAPSSLTGHSAGNSSRTEKNRYRGAVRAFPRNGFPSML